MCFACFWMDRNGMEWAVPPMAVPIAFAGLFAAACISAAFHPLAHDGERDWSEPNGD